MIVFWGDYLPRVLQLKKEAALTSACNVASTTTVSSQSSLTSGGIWDFILSIRYVHSTVCLFLRLCSLNFLFISAVTFVWLCVYINGYALFLVLLRVMLTVIVVIVVAVYTVAARVRFGSDQLGCCTHTHARTHTEQNSKLCVFSTLIFWSIWSFYSFTSPYRELVEIYFL